ncbi:putative transcription factor RfeG [Aspergillus clavatus NRRL 1]|uniref:Transcription factor RfeG, putative n=1 Tax=Aspergillus clavatus (strain ATCC 1007 / CBS 513.65 / DSM 816 / NCTC 3887 / NRRL 1 / QM 1276 / 107) TaxID=344612 RepID=A1CAG0_ASPCL|nr:transcription factor RfeG, putative [Aspergillus clavatus NRRL 1]EAW12728.1 transcription factor RfeG, putative [Aspergillus clavatus NRRL 1]
MTGRHGYEGRPERQNEYFIPGDGISREVIQADICRYLGNDALGRQGYFIRAYRNLTSEMIADLKADSARWEADVMRRADQGYPRGSYNHDYSVSQAPNMIPAQYAASSIHEVRQQTGPSPPPTYSQPPPQPYVDPYAQAPYATTQSPPYTAPSSYPSSHSPFATGQAPYPAQVPYSAPGQPAVSAEMHPSYTYTSNTGYAYENGRNNAPRYTGPGYEAESDYSPVTSGMTYPATTAPDPRIGMDPRYTPEYDRTRPQATRESQAPRRPR